MNRRDFFKILGYGSFISLVPAVINAQEKLPRVIVVGGGFSGRSVAKYLKIWGGKSVEVILIDKNPVYTSPILSNLVLNGNIEIEKLQFDYSQTKSKYNINFIMVL